MIITHIGGPTTLIEIDGWRLLTDPTFDPPGGRYVFGWGASSTKIAGPALEIGELPPIDAVLLTHDQHGDNLDHAGRTLLSTTGTVVTTAAAARRLMAAECRGLRAGQLLRLAAPGRPPLEIAATPARHGPPLSRQLVGEVVGFVVRRPGEERALAWITGDTVLHRRLRRIAATTPVDVLLVHVGGVGFPITGPVRYTMTGRQAVDLIAVNRPRVAVPVHYEGWSHFRDGRADMEEALDRAPEAIRRRVRWLEPGVPVDPG